MTYSISYSGGTLPTPAAVDHPSHDLGAASGTIVHELMNGGIAYTLRQGSTSTGRLRLSYASLSDAKTAYQKLLLAAVFTYTCSSPAISLKFVVIDAVDLQQPLPGGNWWTLSVPIREVT